MRYALAMGAKTAIPAGEYLHTSFPDVDREYRDGELVERTMPDYLHERTQLLLGICFLRLCEVNCRSMHVAKHA
jgi:Uma2 family endonuclease